MFRIILSLFCLIAVPVYAQNRIRITLPTVSQLATRYPFTNEVVEVLGYSTLGDWGPPKLFRWDATNTLATNAIRLKSALAVGRYIHEWDGDVRAFGYKADGVTDDTVALQAALDYALERRIATRLPSGDAVINSVIVGHQALIGEWTAKQNFGDIYGGGTHLIHKNGATNHMIRVRGSGPAIRGALIKNVALQGRGHFNAQNKKTILSSTNRLSFFVATNDLPLNGGSSVSFPYYGHVFFYTSESKYVGYGIASNINYTSGEVSLMAGFDHYATLSSSDYLSAGWSAVFSPSVTAYDDRGQAITAIDPSQAGWCGISFESNTNMTGVTTAVFLPELSNVYIRGFHAGVRAAISLAAHTHELWVNANQFAGICQAFGGYSYDWNMSQTFAQGFYSDWNGNTHPETLSLKNKAYRYQAFGVYGLDTTGMLGDLTLDHNVNGAYFAHGADTHIPALLVDGSIGYGLIFDGSRFGNRAQFMLSSVAIRTWTNYDMTNFGVPPPSVGRRYAIYVLGKNGATYQPVVQIGMLGLTRAGDATNNYDALFHSDTSTASFRISELWQTNGISRVLSTNTLLEYTTGNEVDQAAPFGGLIWNGTNDSYVTAATTNVALGTNDFTIWTKARLPVTPAAITVSSLFALSTSSLGSGGTPYALYAGFGADGRLYTTLNGSANTNGRNARVDGLFTSYPGKIVDIFWRRSSGTLTINVNGRNQIYSESTFGTPPASFAEGITNTFTTVGRGDKSWSDRIYRFAVWNRYLTDEEMTSVLSFGISAGDRRGGPSTSGCFQDLNLGVGSGTNILDRSVNAFHGTLVGTNVFHIE
jgi:hypothetical protein